MLLRLDPRLRRRRAPQRIISYRPSSDGNRGTTRGGSHAAATDLRAFLHVVEGNAERAEDARGIHSRILRRLRRRRGRSRATLGPRLRNAGRCRVGIGRSRGGRGRCRRLPRRHRRRNARARDLLACPGADIVELNDTGFERIAFDEAEAVAATRELLADPEGTIRFILNPE